MSAFRETIGNWFGNAFNTSILKEKRIDWIDYLRGIAIILVVYHHVRVGIERSHITVPSLLVDFNMIFYSFRMPLFFFLSGIFISKALAKKTTRQVIGSKFELLLYPYLIWTVIQISLQIILSNFTNSQRSWIDYTYIFYHPRYLDQFWYLPALFNVSLFYILLKSRLNPPAWMHLAIATALYFLSPFFLKVSMMSDWMEFYIFFAIGNIASELFFKKSTQEFLTSLFALLLILPLFASVQLYYLKHDIGEKTLDTNFQLTIMQYLDRMFNQLQFLLIALVGCLSMVIISFRLQKMRILPFLKVLGYHSLYIYVMHVIVIGFIRLSFANGLQIHNPIILLLAGIFFGVTLPILFYNLFVKNGRPFWFLFSYKRKKEKLPVTTPVQEMKPSMIASQVS